MKRLIMMGFFVAAAACVATAQTTGSNSTNGLTHSGEGYIKKSGKQKKARLNHRRNYNWNTGQQATPTGQEATGNGSGYQSVRKDTAGKRED